MTSVSVDTPDVSNNVDDYKYLVGIMHLEPDDTEHYEVIVAYRRHVTPTGK